MPRDGEYLLDILEAARLARAYVAGKTKSGTRYRITCPNWSRRWSPSCRPIRMRDRVAGPLRG